MDIYKMKLHDIDDLSSFAILRVASGWIYYDKSSNIAVFVPFDNKFQEEYKSPSVGI